MIADALVAVIIAVADGDTLTAKIEDKVVKIRLAEIDAPEKLQLFGPQARASLVKLCLNKPATVRPINTDRYGRTVAHVVCAGTDAATWQVTNGAAWVYVRYAPKKSPLYALEADAKAAGKGLWQEPSPTPPWVWRAHR